MYNKKNKLSLFIIKQKFRSGNYYQTISIRKFNWIEDDDGTKIEFPTETTEYIKIDYLAWTIQLCIWLFIVVLVTLFQNYMNKII